MNSHVAACQPAIGLYRDLQLTKEIFSIYRRIGLPADGDLMLSASA